MKKLFVLILVFCFTSVLVYSQNFYTLTVVQPPTLVVNIGQDVTTCFYDSIPIGSITAISGGEPPYTITWFPTYGLSDLSITNPIALPDDTTTYTIYVTDANNCTSSSQMTVNIDPCAYIAENMTEFSFELYPNPCTDGKVNTAINGKVAGNYHISIYSVYGQLIYNKTLTSTSRSWQGVIDVSGLSKGLYVIEIHNTFMKKFNKLVIQ